MADATTVIVTTSAGVESPIPDFEIQSCIGEGAFGQVYLARAKATGRFRAIKVVRRGRFQSDHPYDIEFAGLKRFEEVSREHEGFVDILHVSRDDQAGCFSYVMELADDLGGAQPFDPARYVPRTLAKELERRRFLPPPECVRVALALTSALAELHGRDLVHRDVNPRNIIFVRGAPKLADVGLVAEARLKPQTLIGTPDYMDAEVHGTPAGDLYSLGKLLYTMATGLEPKQWPDLPKDRAAEQDFTVLRELEAIWRKACHRDRRYRYRDAREIRQELLALQAGASVLRLKRVERAVAWVRRYGLALSAVGVLLLAGLYVTVRQEKQAAELRQRKIGAVVANGNHALDASDYLGALLWFTEAWRLDPHGENDLFHRIRLGSILARAPTLRQVWFQEHQVKEAYFPSEENQVVMSDARGQWRVYDRSDGAPLYAAFGRGLLGERVSLSRPTTNAVTAASTNRIWLWNYHTGATLATLERPGAELRLAAISPDGRWIGAAAASGNAGDEILVWTNAAPHGDPVVVGTYPQQALSLVFSPNSELLLACGTAGEARVWNVGEGRLVSRFSDHEDWIFNGAFSPDSRYAATASFDRSARVWEVETAKEVDRFMHDDAVWAAEFNADRTELATAGLDSTARIWDLARHTCSQVIRHNHKVLRAAFSPQGRYVLTSCFDDTVRVWQLPAPPAPAPANGQFVSGGTRLLRKTDDHWYLGDRSGESSNSLDLGHPPGLRFCLAPDDRFFVALYPVEHDAETSLRLRLFDAAARAPVPVDRTIPLTGSLTNLDLRLSAGGEWLAAFDSASGAIWNLRSGLPLNLLSNGVQRLAFSPNAELLAVGRSNQVEVWNLRNPGAPLTRLTLRPDGIISALAWDPHSRRLITACMNATFTPMEAETWMARTGAKAGPALEHRDGVLYAAFSHSGAWVITCGEDFTATLWDPETGLQVAPPMRHREQVLYAAFSADDRLVATTTADQVLVVWRAATGERLTSLDLPAGLLGARPWLRFTADNQTLLIRNEGTQSYSWELPRCDQRLEDVWLEAHLRSAHQTDNIGRLMPASRDTLRELWQSRLRSRPIGPAPTGG